MKHLKTQDNEAYAIMKNMRVKDLGITKRRKGVKNGKNIGAASRISVAYRLPVSAKLKLVEIANALGLSETAAFVEIIENYHENQEEIQRAVRVEKLRKELNLSPEHSKSLVDILTDRKK